MKLMEANSVDAIVTDPPAGISFMNKSWDSDKGGRDHWIKWLCEIMLECKRVMKPGAHAFVWALPRTSHWTATALENAGFDVRDICTHIFGSGFPKSHDVSKAIDKLHGAEREVVGMRESPYTSTARNETEAMGKHSVAVGENGYELHPITAPSTPDAIKWQGWGSALKPASEHWILVRKPLSESTIAQNVLKWGCGGLNIDASRIETNDNLNGGTYSGEKRPSSRSSFGNGEGGGVLKNGIGRDYVQPQGRFPANILFDECAAQMLDAQSGQQASRYFYIAKASKRERNAGCDSSLIWETETWQGPDLNSLTANINQLAKDISAGILMDESSWSTDLYGHSISEQYPMGMIFTISTALRLITELKTSNASQNSNTRESIQDAIKMIEANGLSLVESVEFINQLNLSSIREQTASLLGVVRAALPMLLQIKGFAKSGNFHSTVKPTKLMQYLIKLICPPNGTVLDPFAGSGSTGVACKQLGFNFVGIEISDEYADIADKRIEHANVGL